VAKVSTKLTQTKTTKETTEKRAKAHKRYVINPHDIPYYEDDALYRKIDREDKNKLQFDLTENVVNSSDDGSEQPSDEDSQGNVFSINKIDVNTEEDVSKAPHKAYTKPKNYEEEQPAPSSENK
jgi:hypothetical protein